MKRVLVMTGEGMVPPEGEVDPAVREASPWKTDYDVVLALRHLGFETTVVGLVDDLAVLRDAIRELRPHVVFNLLEEFAGDVRGVGHVLGYLELIGQPYTGCNPAGMLFATDKALQRKILRYHRIRTPEFAVARMGRVFRPPSRLEYPLIVKSLTDHGSMGISQASVVNKESDLIDRIAFIHEQVGSHAIVERYIHGRELYVSILGNERLEVFPIWDLHVATLKEGRPLVVTEKLKWDPAYQKQVGLTIGPSKLEAPVRDRLVRACKRVYRSLEQSGYARIDVRLDEEDRAWIIESNPNPQLSRDEEFAESAAASGLSYEALIKRIVSLGVRWSKG